MFSQGKSAFIFFFLATMAMSVTGCLTTASQDPGRSRIYTLPKGDGLLEEFAPLFVVEHAEKAYNRIGTPKAKLTRDNHAVVYVDPEEPTIFADQQEFHAGAKTYTNLIYRVHFARSPFTLLPFNTGAGKNVGVMAVITLNEDLQPILVNTVQTCGCYHAVIPTDHTPEYAFPKEWDSEGFKNYGEQLPGILQPYSGDARLFITLKDGVHRVKDLAVGPIFAARKDAEQVQCLLRPLEALKHIPLPENGETSLYFQKGRKRGLVRGAFKPWETALFGLWIRDFHVGQDREFGTRQDTGQLFYTTLNPRIKHASDMSDYAAFLRLNGWAL